MHVSRRKRLVRKILVSMGLWHLAIKARTKLTFDPPLAKDIGDIRKLDENMTVPPPLSADYGEIAARLILNLSWEDAQKAKGFAVIWHPKRAIRRLTWKHREIMAQSHALSRSLCLAPYPRTEPDVCVRDEAKNK